jgi:acylphosphatase
MADAGAHLLISGVVQGVGYRFFAIRKADAYGLKGFAQNLIDGSVEVVAEGDRGLIEEFIKDLRRGPISAHVSDIRIEWTTPTYKFQGFQGL